MFITHKRELQFAGQTHELSEALTAWQFHMRDAEGFEVAALVNTTEGEWTLNIKRPGCDDVLEVYIICGQGDHNATAIPERLPEQIDELIGELIDKQAADLETINNLDWAAMDYVPTRR